MAPCRETVSCFGSSQVEVRDQGLIQHLQRAGRDSESCSRTLQQGVCLSSEGHELWMEDDLLFIIPPCCLHFLDYVSYPLLLCPFARKWGDWFHFKHKSNCGTHTSCGGRSWDKVHPLCELVVLQPTHKHTGGHACVLSIHTLRFKKNTYAEAHTNLSPLAPLLIVHLWHLLLLYCITCKLRLPCKQEHIGNNVQNNACVCVFVSTLWCMHRDRGEAINEYPVLATSCFSVNIAVSLCARGVCATILPNRFSSQEMVECHSFYHPPPLL